MKIVKSKKDNVLLISALKKTELFALLKCQIPCTLRFTDTNGVFVDAESIELGLRGFNGSKQVISVNETEIHYSQLITMISERLTSGLVLIVSMEIDVFKNKEPLIVLLSNLKDNVVESCLFINYDKEVFEIQNRPFKNGDSDKLFFFEANNSLLAFTENGPVLITDNNNINSIEDVICK